jgi:hypothetical protein
MAAATIPSHIANHQALKADPAAQQDRGLQPQGARQVRAERLHLRRPDEADVGASWEGFAIENLIAAAPYGTQASFYRTSAGAEIDLVLEIPKQGLWAIEIKRVVTGRPERGFHIVCDDLRPSRRFVVNAGQDRYPLSPDLEAIGVRDLAADLETL